MIKSILLSVLYEINAIINIKIKNPVRECVSITMYKSTNIMTAKNIMAHNLRFLSKIGQQIAKYIPTKAAKSLVFLKTPVGLVSK